MRWDFWFAAIAVPASTAAATPAKATLGSFIAKRPPLSLRFATRENLFSNAERQIADVLDYTAFMFGNLPTPARIELA
jgi:hypothetical protein